MNKINAGAALALLLLLSACGGGSSGSSGSSSSSSSSNGGNASSANSSTSSESSSSSLAAAETGVFSDSPVAGVHWDNGRDTGVTNAAGEFSFREGDSVQFSIGGINFPSVQAKSVVTPLDMGGEGANLTTPEVTNILRLLQTLDEDGDPENGITISGSTASALADIELDFAAASFESEAGTAVQNQLNRELVSEEEAVAHFRGSLDSALLGSWVFVEDNGNVNVLTFLDPSTYVIAHSQAIDEQAAASVEYGLYTWDPISGDFSVTDVIRESDSDGGLYNADEPAGSLNLTAKIAGGELVVDFGEGDTVAFTSANEVDHPLAGAWSLYETDSDNHNVLTFYSASDYVLVHTNNAEAYIGGQPQAASSEWGTYSWSAASGDFAVTAVSAESDGDGGLYNAEEADDTGMTLSASANGDLLFADSDETFAFSRIGSFSVPLQDREGDASEAVVKRDLSFFGDGVAERYYLRDMAAGQDGVYDIAFSEAYTELTLNDDGTGQLHFPPSEDNGQDPNDINALTWELSSSGALRFTEVDGDGLNYYWTLTPVAGKHGPRVLRGTTVMEGGESQSIAVIETLYRSLPAPQAGAWYISGDGFHYALFLLNSHRYAAIDFDAAAGDNGSGAYEVGSYSMNDDGTITVEADFYSGSDLDAQPPFANGNGYALDGDVLTLTDADEDFTLTRLQADAAHPLQGGWFVVGQSELVTLAFANGVYLIGQLSPSTEEGMPGMEYGTYTYDPETEAFAVTTLYDTNGQWGFSHPCAVLDVAGTNNLACGENGAEIEQTFSVSGDVLVFVSEADTIDAGGEEQPVALVRVKPVVH